jgi:Family of unknown function (DUF6236)
MQRPGLYYPFIRIDDDWLKTAALFWPAIWRVMPSAGAARHDSPVSQAFAEAGILVDESSTGWRHYLSRGMLRAVERNAGRLAARFSVEQARRDWDGRTWGDNSGDGRDPRLGWLYVSKMGAELPDVLAGHGLAVLDPGFFRGGWIGLHPVLAGAYMCALALYLGEQAYLQPVTDQADLRVAALSDNVAAALSLLLGEQAARGAGAASSAATDIYVMLALQCARPRHPARVTAQQIIACRENLREELDAFRGYVAAQQAELAELAAIPMPGRRLEAFAEHVEQTIERPLQRLEKGLRLHRLEPARSLLLAGSIAPPLAVGSILTALGTPAVASTATGALAAIGTAWWQVGGTRRQAKAGSPAGYLLDVRDRLTPKTLAGRARKLLVGSYG